MPKLLDILLQRNDTSVPWGFQVRAAGGPAGSRRPIISSVTFGTLAAQYLNAGDRILEIEKRAADTLGQSEIERILGNELPRLQLLVEKLPAAAGAGAIRNRVAVVEPQKKLPKSESFKEVVTERQCVREKEADERGVKHSTKIWLRETNRNPSLGEYDLEVNFERTKYREKPELWGDPWVPDPRQDFGKSRNLKRMQAFSENFDKIFKEKIGEWLETNMLGADDSRGKQQSSPAGPAGDGTQGVQPPPPPPPSFPGTLPGRRLKSEVPERGLEPPSVIQNAMMTKDKKPFTYTPGGIDLSEIRSPKMQRRINRNACADEMPGIPAPTTNQPAVSPPANSHFAAMQSQLPAQVLPPGGAPPPPPPPPPSGGEFNSAPPPPAPPVAAAAPKPQPNVGRPPLGFDPNELLARVNKSPAYEPSVASNREEPPRHFKPAEEKPSFEPKQQKSNEIGQNIYVPLQNEPGHIYVPQVAVKAQNEPPVTYAPPAPTTNHSGRGQLGSLYVPPVTPVGQEQSTPSPTSPFGYKAQQNSPAVSSPAVDTKPQAPWVTVYRTPQPSVPWGNRESESPKPAGTRIIPIQIEGRDSPKPGTPSPQPQATPPPFLQNQQMRQQQQPQPPFQQQQTMRQPQQAPQPQQTMRQTSNQPQSGSTRVIPIQIEGSSQPTGVGQQPRSPGQNYNQKFNPMAPMSPTPYSPTQEKDQKPQWAPVQPRPFKNEPAVNQQRPQQGNESFRNQQPQPEYGTYNTAGVPLSQLRKMQLSEDDRALMDKFKSQVERHGNDILSDENSNPRYRGGYIPSRVFKILDESVDDEVYLHRESDPRYRGAVIPSRAFRMLQSMTDTAGDVPQPQVPRSPSRGPTSRPVSGVQYQQEVPQGPYVPPSEQQAQEPRKYTGGSIPSRSFRMLQAMTGQEVSAPNPSSGSQSGRETPVSGINRWCPSPSPSPVDPFWGYYPPDPYFMYNYISDLNAAYGFPPPPLPPAYPQPPPFHPSYYQMCQNYSSDNDEQGYSSTDELAQYYSNYRRNFGYSPFQPERYCPTPNSFKVPRVCVTPVQGMKKADQFQKPKVGKPKEPEKDVRIIEVERLEEPAEEDDQTSSEEDSETDTEVEEEAEEPAEEEAEAPEDSAQIPSLQTLKSVSNLNVYTSESSSTVVQEEIEELEEISSSESLEEAELEEKVPHQLSVIFEESEHSDVESIKRQEPDSLISESESCSTLDNGEDDSDNDILDAEASVIVRLPLKLKFSRTEDDEDVTTVIVGDSEVQRDTLYNLHPAGKVDEEEEDEEESYESDDADISVTFTVPTRSNSVISVDAEKIEELTYPKQQLGKLEEVEIQEEPEVDTEVTVCLPLARKSEPREEERVIAEAKTCESPHLEEDSSSTSIQSGDTILKHKEDTDEESEDEEEKPKTFKSWIEEENSKDWNETDKTAETDGKEDEDEDEEEEEDKPEEMSYEAGVGRLEEMISSLLETTKDTMSSSMELSPKDLEPPPRPLGKKDSQEESEEDDSGVTSDMSIKQMNSETDADTESDYSELSKMTKFQRASTHSRLFKLLQEECEKNGNEGEDDDSVGDPKPKTEDPDTLSSRKQKLTLPLNQTVHSEAESLSSSSGIASPSSPTISDRLVKELIHSLLNKKKGKKFRKLPLAKLHAAALKILQEETDPYDTSPTSGDDGLFLSPIHKKKLHSRLTAVADSEHQQYLEPVPESIYGENYYAYLDYYNTWDNPELYYPEDYDIVPSRAFRMLREQTESPKPIEGFKARCPRVASRKNVQEPAPGRKTPVVANQEPDDDPEYQNLTFSEKQEKVGKVLEKSKMKS